MPKRLNILTNQLNTLFGGKFAGVTDSRLDALLGRGTRQAIADADPRTIDSVRQVAHAVIADLFLEVENLQQQAQFDD